MITEKKVSLTALRKQLSSLETAKKSGYAVPQPLLEMVKGEILKREGVVEVWECVPCSERLELGVRAKGVACKCGKIRRTWKA